MNLIDNIKADLEKLIQPAQSGICQHCWRIVDNIVKHECNDESPGDFLRHMEVDDGNKKYARAMSYSIQ